MLLSMYILYDQTLISSTTSSGAYYKYRMERTMYAVKGYNPTVRDRLWHYTQYESKDIHMYRTRLSRSTLAWVIEIPKDKRETLFLLQFADYVYKISHTYYT